MSTEEDTELRDLVIESLDKKGILGKIKAELRATVFLALEDTSLEKCKISFQNEPLQKYMETVEGLIVVSLVRDFLKQFHLDYTLAVFEPEVSLDGEFLSQNDLISQLKVKVGERRGSPVLSSIFQDFFKAGKEFSPKTATKTPEWVLKPKPPVDILEIKPHLKIDSSDKSGSFDGAEDNFFDDPVPANDQKPLLFSFLGKNLSEQEKSVKKDNEKEKPEPSPLTDVTFTKSQRKDSLPDSSQIKSISSATDKPSKEKTASSLSSLKDLPSILPNPQIKRKGSDIYEDDFQSSLSQGLKFKDPDDTEASIEEDIDEDISAAANDILNSLSSQGEDLTVDKSIANSGAKGFDYLEKLS